MKRFLVLCAAFAGMTISASAANDTMSASTANDKDDTAFPTAAKWLSSREAIFSFDGSFEDEEAFVVDAKTGARRSGVKAPEKFSSFPVNPEGAVNLTYSPDSTKLAFTRANDLYVIDIATQKEQRLTFDGTDLILNGYASWVYYEEIFGRPTKYRAFWWAPDSKHLAFYRFDNTQVPLFPIYSPFGQDGSLRNTRYPKAGERNPEVRIGIADLTSVTSEATGDVAGDMTGDMTGGATGDMTGDVAGEATGVKITWADFDPTEDQYFGTPFWGADSKEIYISHMPRIQNTLDLYAVNAADGSKRHVYHESYKTWLDWITGMIFTDKGLYMARSFETGWEQIYFLSYDGKIKRLTSGPNWTISLVAADEKSGCVYYTAKRDASVRYALYCVDAKGHITCLTDPAYSVSGVKFSPDYKYFTASYSNGRTPTKLAIFDVAAIKSAARADSRRAAKAGLTDDYEVVFGGNLESGAKSVSEAGVLNFTETALNGARPTFNYKPSAKLAALRLGRIVADKAFASEFGPAFDASKYALPQVITMTTPDGFVLPALIVYPKNFDATKQYPVHMDIYGGPDTPLVNDVWRGVTEANQWWSNNDIIQITCDCRAAGHNGRQGLDFIYKSLAKHEVADFILWAGALQQLPYVDADKIGVEGFSFGGTMTTMLVSRAPEYFHYGIAGGGVYDWALYDTHYTERFMETPQTNPEGYHDGCCLNFIDQYVTVYPTSSDHESAAAIEPVMLKLTHGTGDDNVHFQNTLQLIDKMHKGGKKFEFMIYPDGMHGYHGYQGDHFSRANHEFWLKYLKR